MKKNGFTLAEILIALGVIGIVAAVTIPGLLGRNVDNDKARVIAIVKSIEDTTQELLNDPEIYYTTENKIGESTTTCEGLGCIGRPTKAPFNDDLYNGNSKYPQLIANSLNKVGNIEGENTSPIFHPLRDVNCQLTANPPDPVAVTDTLQVRRFASNLTIAIGVPVNEARIFPDENPNGYRFTIDNNGRVHGDDPLSRAYLMNPTELNNREADLTKAEEILANESEDD